MHTKQKCKNVICLDLIINIKSRPSLDMHVCACAYVCYLESQNDFRLLYKRIIMASVCNQTAAIKWNNQRMVLCLYFYLSLPPLLPLFHSVHINTSVRVFACLWNKRRKYDICSRERKWIENQNKNKSEKAEAEQAFHVADNKWIIWNCWLGIL